MRKLVLKMSVSIDGFVGGPNGEIDWIFKSMDASVLEWLAATLETAGLHIMGSRTYQDMVAYWPHSSDILAAPMNEIPKVVFSKKGIVAPDARLTTTALKDASRSTKTGQVGDATSLRSWREARVASGHLAEEIQRLKREPGNYILAHGGAGFARSLAATGLVDEYRLLIHPVALGVGLPLFASLTESLHLQLVESTAFNSGAIASVYRAPLVEALR
jgi:dihydrofolate reductase